MSSLSKKGPAIQIGTKIKITRGLKARADISFQVLQRKKKTFSSVKILNPPIKAHKQYLRIAPVA